MAAKVLHDAARYNNSAEVKRLICFGADVNMKNEFGWTALHFAAYKNEVDSHFEVIKLLLKSGADVNAQSFGESITPIFELTGRFDFKTIKLLLDFGADLKFKDNNDYNSLFPAVFNNTFEVVKLLVENGADAGIRRNGHSILHWACMNKRTEVVQIVKYLIKNGADIESRCGHNYPPLNFVLKSKTVPLLLFFCKYAGFSSVVFSGFSKISRIKNKDVWTTFIKHLAKLKILNITVDPNFFEEISKRKEFVDYIQMCTKELVEAKHKKLKNSWVSYFNLLVDSKRKLKNYAGNQDLIRDFKNSDCLKKFPIYGAEMQKNVEKGLKMRELFDKSSIALSNCLLKFDPNHLIIRDILDCNVSYNNYTLFLSDKKNF